MQQEKRNSPAASGPAGRGGAPAGPDRWGGAPAYPSWAVLALWCLVGLLLVYVLLPVLPLIVVDGDDIAVAAGALQLSLYGQDEHELVYSQIFLPGTYAVLVGLHRTLALDPWVGFWLLTIGGFALYFPLASLFVSRLAAIPLPLAALVLLLFQESFVSAYFMNPSMLAGGLLLAACLLASRGGRATAVAAGLLAACAAWFRVDVVLLGAVFPALIWRGDRASVLRLAWFSGAATTAAVPLLLLGGLSPAGGSLFELYGYHIQSEHNPGLTLVAYLTVFTGLTVLLVALGIYGWIRSRSIRLLVVCLAGAIPPFLAYGLAVTTPRYFLYSLPFVAAPAAVGLRAVILRRRGILPYVAAVLLLAQYLFDPCAAISCQANRWTFEGPRMLASIGGVPRVWTRLKRARSAGYAFAEELLNEAASRETAPLIVAWDYPERMLLKYHFLSGGYRCVEGVPFDGGYLRVYERPEGGAPVSVLSVYYTSEELPAAVLRRLGEGLRGPAIHFGRPREAPPLLRGTRPVRVGENPEIFLVDPASGV